MAQAVEIREDFRVELALRGEPTMNPDLLGNLQIIRKIAPKFQVSLFTNGLLFLKSPGLVKSVLDAGVNLLCVEGYDGRYSRLERVSRASGERVELFQEFSAYKRHRNGHQLRVIVLVPDIHSGTVQVRKIHNNAGNVSREYLESLPGYTIHPLPLDRRCVRPFRELVVYYDGNVVVCCHDWKAERVLGNIQQGSLFEIWYGQRHLEVLRRIYSKQRDLEPCCVCDYHGGYRVGLLQDPRKAKGNPAR